MSRSQMNLQDAFLNSARKEEVPVTVTLVDGSQRKGQVRGFDNFTLVLEQEGELVLVYKHAVACIAPQRPLTNFN